MPRCSLRDSGVARHHGRLIESGQIHCHIVCRGADSWLVDPADRTLDAFELRAGGWALIASAKESDPVSVRPFDAVTFSLGDLWP